MQGFEAMKDVIVYVLSRKPRSSGHCPLHQTNHLTSPRATDVMQLTLSINKVC